MSDLGYIPNLTARSLITKRQNNWYYFKSASKDVRQNPFYSDVLHGITQRCNEEGYAIKVRYRLQKKVFSRSTRDDTYACCRWIYFTFSKSNNVIKQLLIDEDVPFVVIGKPLDEKTNLSYILIMIMKKQVMIYVVIYIIKAIVTLFSSMNQVNML